MCKEELIKDIGRFRLVHSTLEPSPGKWDYLKIKNASQNFAERKIVFVGHSHIPAIYSRYSSGQDWNPIQLFGDEGYYRLPISPEKDLLPPGKANKFYRLGIPDSFPTMVINIGSVGQPRDHNPNARYLLYITVDYKTYIEYRQVGYDVPKTISKLKQRNLSCDRKLAVRLCTAGPYEFSEDYPQPDWFNFDD